MWTHRYFHLGDRKIKPVVTSGRCCCVTRTAYGSRKAAFMLTLFTLRIFFTWLHIVKQNKHKTSKRSRNVPSFGATGATLAPNGGHLGQRRAGRKEAAPQASQKSAVAVVVRVSTSTHATPKQEPHAWIETDPFVMTSTSPLLLPTSEVFSDSG